MRKALKKAQEKSGRLIDRLLPSSGSSPESADLGSSSNHPSSPPLEQHEEARLQQTRAVSAESSARPQAVNAPPPTPPDHDPIPSAPSTGRHEYASPSEAPTGTSTTGSVIKEFLEVARDASDAFLPLKAALVGVVQIWDICERTAGVKDSYNDLESRLAHLRAVTEALGKRGPMDANLKQRLDSIAQSFQGLTVCVEAKIERGLVKRVLESRADIDEVNAIIAKISVRIEAFIYESMVRVEIGVGDILSRLPTAEERRLQNELENWREIVKVIASALDSRRVHEAAHDAQPKDAGCMPGTRVNVLLKFMSWVKDDPKSVLWLAGMAGTGKTSIAVTLCRMLEQDSDVLLGGAFFCSRTSGVEARTDVRCILPTLAGLLSDQSPKFASQLAAELRPTSGAAVRKPVSDQISLLLQRPLAALAAETRPIVFVIDALDECSNERELAELLSAIVNCKWAANVKFILTSRPETHILGTPIADRVQNDIIQLHIIDATEVTEDIRLYISDTFSKSQLAKPWYSEVDVRTLAALSEGLFIFASTITSYVLKVQSVKGRASRLQTALSVVRESKVALGPLDAMYEFVLTRASDTAEVEPEELKVTLQVLACILAAHTPLSVNAMAELLGVETDELRESMRRLYAVVYEPEEADQPGLRMLHASFGDYLLARGRIAKTLGDEALARGCLRVMQDRLHFNISESRSSYEPNRRAARPSGITPSLEYASMQWIYHVSNLVEPSILDDEVDKTLRLRVLFWFEVMSVLGRVSRAAAMLLLAASTIQSVELSQFFRDAHAFVASSRQAIERSTPHIYLSAIPFAAKDSLLYQTFTPLLVGLVSVDTFGIDRHGGRLVTTLIGHEMGVYSISYSRDGHFIASGSSDTTVRIWDTRSGEEMMSPLVGDSSINSVAFAPDGRSLAVGTGLGEVCIWNLSAGMWTPQRLTVHSDYVTCVEFSPDGALLVSASGDNTVCLWEAKTGNQVSLFEGHEDIVNEIVFSPAGDIIASGADDMTIRLWRSETGKPAGQALTGHTGPIRGVSFSSDGMRLASGSQDRAIKLWDTQTGTCIATLQGHTGWIRSVQFSPDGQSLASAADDHHVRIWTLQQDVAEISSTVLDGHLGNVYSVKFSPDGLYVASASDDCAIRLWDAGSSQTTVRPLQAHSSGVNSLAVSADGDLIVSGSVDRSVRIWNAQTGEPKLPPLLGHAGSVHSVAISPDGRMIASASEDHTVRVWDAQTGEMVGEPLQGHEGDVNAVAFSPDTRWLASGSGDTTVRIWDCATLQPLNIGPLRCEDWVRTVAFSPDVRFVAVGDDGGRLHLWNMDTGQPAHQPFHAKYEWIVSIAFSPSGAHIASAGGDLGRVWDIGTGQQILTLEGHRDKICSIAFSHNGQYLVTGSEYRKVRLWDAKTGSQLAILRGHGDHVMSVAFTPDGQSIISGALDSTIRIWDVQTALKRSYEYADDLLTALESARLDDGWLLGRSGEIFLWVPADYRPYLKSPSCKVLIPERHVSLTTGEVVHCGENWMKCWRGAPSA